MLTIYIILTQILNIVLLILILRALSSWFPQVRESQIGELLHMLSEPIVMPFRELVKNVDALRNLPIDISFLLAFFAIRIVQELLIVIL